MNYCSNCGHKVDGAKFCANCGTQLKFEEQPTPSAPSAPAAPPTPVQTNTYYPSHIAPQGNSQVFLSNLFAEKDEQPIYTFGNEQYIQFLNQGKIKKAFAILSDRRLYIRGKRYEVTGKGSSNPDDRGKAVKTEKVVDVKDVKTIEIGRVGRTVSLLYLYSSVIVTVLTIVALVVTLVLNSEVEYSFNHEEATAGVTLFTMITLGLAAAAASLWVSFASSIKSCISLLCKDTWIRFPLEKYVSREGYALMRHIIILQMPYREKVSAPGSDYNDSIFAKDGKLVVKSKKIKPAEPSAEKAVNLNEITDIKVFNPSRKGLNALAACLCVIFAIQCLLFGFTGPRSLLSLILIIVLLVYMSTPTKAVGLKVTCNNTWFSFPIQSKQEGADIMRYIVEQQVYHEQNTSSITQ